MMKRKTRNNRRLKHTTKKIGSKKMKKTRSKSRIKKYKTKRNSVRRRRRRIPKYSKDGSGFKEIMSALLGIDRAKKMPFVESETEQKQKIKESKEKKDEMKRISNRSVEFYDKNSEDLFANKSSINLEGEDVIDVVMGRAISPEPSYETFEDIGKFVNPIYKSPTKP